MGTESFWIYILFLLIILIVGVSILIKSEKARQKRYNEMLSKMRKADLRLIG